MALRLILYFSLRARSRHTAPTRRSGSSVQRYSTYHVWSAQPGYGLGFRVIDLPASAKVDCLLISYLVGFSEERGCTSWQRKDRRASEGDVDYF